MHLPSDMRIALAGALTPFDNMQDELLQVLIAGQCAIQPSERYGAPVALMPRRERDGPITDALAMDVATWADIEGRPDGRRLLVYCTTKGRFDWWLAERNAGKQAKYGLFSEVAETLAVQKLHYEGFRTVSNACVSGAQGVIEAAEALLDGDCDTAVVVGSDHITEFISQGFSSLNARSSHPARPFDHTRDGLSLGEACAAVLLKRSNDPRFPRLVSYGCSNDANHISGPSQDGSGLALAIERALDGIDKSEIRAICAHGTATVYNDAMEARAFHTVFEGAPPPVFGIKGAIGHTLGAAGLIEVIVSATVATEGLIPPTVGFEQGEVNYPLDVVRGEPRKIEPGYVLTTNSGFGGMNTAIVVGPGTL